MIFKKINENLIDETLLEKFSKTFCLDKKIIQILYNRGFKTEEEIRKFLNNDINNLKDPFLMLNMEAVVERIILSIKNQEKVLIFGDYDTDGIGAVSILYNFLITKNPNVTTYIPNRLEDGYGLSCPCIDKIAIKEKPNLIITVDCGISCNKEVDYIKDMGIDIIVTDHHQLPSQLPNCLILSPKLDQKYNFDGLCGAGVAFKLIQALCFKFNENFERFLPICAISTIADIVPLIDDNRIIVKEGLKRLEKLPIGVKFLIKNIFKDLKNISSTDIAFKLAPRLNSTGRLDDANISLNLFVSNDLKLINKSLEQIEYINEKRKNICAKIFDEAQEILEKEKNFDNVIILYKEDWDIGVLGIAAAKLCEEFNKPTILFGKCGNELKGSGRSVGNIDIFKVFSACEKVLINFGGHTKAGGLSLEEKNLNKFKCMASSFLQNAYSVKDYEVVKEYDLELEAKDITPEFVENLSLLEPFGTNNLVPVFCINTTFCKVSKMKNFPNHLTLLINNNLNLISFNDEKNYENYQNFAKKQFLIELQINDFKGRKIIKGLVKNCKFFQPKKILFNKLLANFFEQILCEEKDTKLKYFNSENQLLEIVDDNTLVVTYKTENILKNADKMDVCSFHLMNGYGEKTLIFGLKNFEKLNAFKKIVFLEKPLNLGYIFELKKHTSAEIFVPNNNKFSLNVEYKLSREILLDIYFKFTKAISKNITASDLYSYYEKLVLVLDFKYSYLNFYVALKIFQELKIVEQTDENMIKFKHNKIKTDLTKSVIFQKINE